MAKDAQSVLVIWVQSTHQIMQRASKDRVKVKWIMLNRIEINNVSKIIILINKINNYQVQRVQIFIRSSVLIINNRVLMTIDSFR